MAACLRDIRLAGSKHVDRRRSGDSKLRKANTKVEQIDRQAAKSVHIESMNGLLSCLPTLLCCMRLLRPIHGQQEPFVALQKFVYLENNITYRTNVCERQKLLYTNETLLLDDALRGLNLSVAITNYKVANEDAFFTLKNGRIKEQDPGLFVVILDEIARRAGFEWRNSFSAIDPIDPTTDGDHTWTDLLTWEVAHFDIAADYWFRTQERIGIGVSFPHGWYDAGIVIAQNVVQQDNKFWLLSFSLPFEGMVWLAIVGAILFTGSMYLLLERLDTLSDERELENKPLVSIFLASLTFTGHFEYKPNTMPARLLSFSWTFWALIMASAYTANLASFLLVRNEVQFTIGTLADAMRLEVPLCLQSNSYMEEFVKKKYPKMKVVRKSTEQEIFDALRLDPYDGSGGCRAALTNLGIFEIYQHQKNVNWDCSLTSKKQVIQNILAGFATAFETGGMCTSLISQVLNIHLYQMVSDGFVDREWQNHLLKTSTIDCLKETGSQGSNKGDQDENFSLRFKDMAGIFVVHGCLSVVALIFGLSGIRKVRNREKDDGDAPALETTVPSPMTSAWPGLTPLYEHSDES